MKRKKMPPIIMLTVLGSVPAFALFDDGAHDGRWGTKVGIPFSVYSQEAQWYHYASNNDDYYETYQEGSGFPDNPQWITPLDAASNKATLENDPDWASE